MTKNIKKKSWMRWLVFLAGLEIIAISINFFYGPINIAAGGSTGISILVDAVWGINRSITVLVVNILMLILAAIFLGKKTTKNVALGSLLLPVLMGLTPSFKITNNQLLAVIYGGALMGLGVSLLYRVNASSGGTTIPPMILKKYFEQEHQWGDIENAKDLSDKWKSKKADTMLRFCQDIGEDLLTDIKMPKHINDVIHFIQNGEKL